ncbi:hypothetical protein BC833DRAFT_593286 [Globomyces pollinis-pini]|nr:hypothetical protein BC833DRAFT_593286 [Globomyces pollinis-pini]KAJ2996715.1 hypothetical protein HDV02_006275 [Globomyces sp. JEL0801]
MSGIPLANVLPLEGGAVCSGIALTVTAQCLYRYGVAFNILNDVSRQKLVNLICFIGSIGAMLFYGLNQTKVNVMATNVTIFVAFLCGQYGQVIINHNSIIRLASANATAAKNNIQQIQKYCLLLYILPFFTMFPILLAYSDTMESGKPLTTSYYNLVISKYLFMGIVVITELFATYTDIKLLKRVEDTVMGGKHAEQKESRRQDIKYTYRTIWFFMIIDFGLKVLISLGYPVLFDAITTLIVISLRTQSNLSYGLLMKEIVYGSSSQTTKSEFVSMKELA